MFALCRVSRAALIAATALAAITTSQQALAAPPSVTGTPINLFIPPSPGVQFTIDLRVLGAIEGSAPLIIQPTSLQILVNGQTTATLQAFLFPNNGPGRICVTVRNTDHTVTPSNSYALRFAVGGLPGNSTTPVTTVPIINARDEMVDTPAEQAACNDPNTPPVANAGADRTIPDSNGQPGEPVVLQGSGSDVNVGTVLTYTWLNAAGAQIATGPTPTVTLADGTHTLTLRVTDDSFDPQTNSDTDTVTITVQAPVANQPPTANAGPDRTIPDSDGAPGEVVPLNGGQSSDPDGEIVSYQWSRVLAGAVIPLGTGVTLSPTLTDGTHTIRLTVTDDDGATDIDEATITVSPPPNQPPVANAGADRTVPDTNGTPGELVTLNGGQSSDPDGTITTYQWFRVVGGVETLLGAGVTFNATLPDGANTIRLRVTDDDGATDADDATITVTPPNQPPVANAGPDRTIADTNGGPGEVVALNGGQSNDPDGAITTYQWSRVVNGVATPLGTGVTLNVNLPDGPNTIRLQVTDDDGATDTDDALITVTPAANQPPVANAGPDRTIADTNGAPGETVALNGGQSDDPDGEIATYQWFRVVDGVPVPLGTGVTLNATLPDGANTVRLIVTDDDGATDPDDALITVTPPVANQLPVANAGADRTVADTNGAPGEVVALNGGQSDDPDGEIVLYQWSRIVDGEVEIPLGTGVTLNATLPDGVNNIRLQVTDDDEATDDAVVQITVTAPAANQPPVANAGADRTIADANGAPGEIVALNGGQSNDPDGEIETYQWFRIVDGEVQVPLGTGATLSAPLPDGVNIIRLLVTDDDGATDDDTAQITVTPPVVNGLPTANAGPDRTINDTNGAPGEPVTLDGTASSDPDGPLSLYQWFRLGGEVETLLGTGATFATTLPDGVNNIRLVVTDSAGAVANDIVQIIVNALNSAPTVNAGADQIVPDTDRNPGELVTLTGVATDVDGSVSSYQWFLGETSLGAGATLQARLPNGVNIVTLAATDNTGNVGRDTVQVTVGAPSARSALADLPNLDPNMRKTAQALDRICAQLDGLDDVATNVLSADQIDLRNRCDAIYFDQSQNATANKVDALEALAAEDFAVARTQTLLFANTQYASIMDRLIALRGGARGLSLAGLNIMVDGQMVPLAELRDMVKDMFGGGASSDADKAGGLLSDKWGMWARGNYSFGDKGDDRLSPSFDADQWALVGGVDYRLSDRAVVGAALSYGDSTIDFAANDGGLDTASWAASLYGSLYAAKNFYFDAILNVANSSYRADRNIVYNNGVGLVDLDASGDTDGMVLSGGASGGYDFLIGGLTVSPTVGFFYIDATIDSFTERGAGGLNLIYDEQQFKSLTGSLGARLTYAWNLPWGVLLPHLRVDYVREFEDDVDVFGVRFAADPNATSAPPILIETDNPDQSYFRIAAGFSAQFRYGFSGYVEYQRLESFEFISFQDVSIGLRMQRSF